MSVEQHESFLSDRFVVQSESNDDAVQAFHAYDAYLRRSVVVETLGFGDFDDWSTFDRFERRCQLLARLRHISLPRYLDHGQDPRSGRFFLATLPAEGHLLETTREAGRRYEEVALRAIAWQLVDLLEYVHGQLEPVILLDITPSNLILRKDGRLVLRRLLHARLLRETGSDFDHELPYVAPEVLEGRPMLASDIYALGATLAALAGAPGRDLLAELDGVLPDGVLRRLIATMLHPDATARPTLRQIRGALRGESVAIVTHPVVRSKALRRKRRSQAIAMLRREALPLARTIESGAVIGCAGAAFGVSLQELCVHFLGTSRGIPEAYLVVTFGTILLGVSFMLGASYGSRLVQLLASRMFGRRRSPMPMLTDARS